MGDSTFKYLMLAIGAFLLVNSILTVIFTTITWLVNNYGWKAWVVLIILVMIIGYILYINLGKVLILIQ